MRVGERVRHACEIVDAAGVCKSSHVRLIMGVSAHVVTKYLTRAVGMQLLMIDRTNYPHEFRVASDWRTLAAPPEPIEPEKPARPNESIMAQALRTQPNSIFQIGSRSMRGEN